MDCVPSFGPRAYIASWPLFRQRLLCGPDISRGHLTKRPVPTITNALSPSSIRLGRRPLKPLRRVQIPLVTPFSEDCNWRHAPITPFRGSKGIPSSLFFVKGFSQLSELWRAKQKSTRYAGGKNLLYKKHLSHTIELFKPIVIFKRKVFLYGNSSSKFSSYKMVVQVSHCLFSKIQAENNICQYSRKYRRNF